MYNDVFLNANILPINYFVHYKLLAETMHDVSNDPGGGGGGT